MRTFINLLLPLTPALAIFGPLIIVIGYDPSNHLWADVGAFMTGIGILILFLKIMDQSRQIEEITRLLEGNDQKNPRV
ncbi:MAG: hypothetical protein WCA79_13780 [Anaerolineales bacterium]